MKAHVGELRPPGEFATWRAARAVGDHDLNGFRLRLASIVGTAMTIWLPEPS
jgi:HlyD family secretion protein